MEEDTDPTCPQREPESLGVRLDSWKQIAAYLNRHVTTVRRWEKCEGLLVHRHIHSKLGSIYAYSRELDAWFHKRRSSPSDRSHPAGLIVAKPAGPPLVSNAGVRDGPVGLQGREAEWKALGDSWSRAREGRPELVVITGEPGAGKTRLAFAFSASLSHSANVLTGRCDPLPHLPFTPFVEMLQGILHNVPAERLRDWLAEIEGSIELAHLLPEMGRLIRPASACFSTTPEGHRFRMFEAFTKLVRAMARSGPVLVVIEDVHWADEGSMLLLRYLLCSTHDAALCVIVTCCETELQHVRWSAELLADLRREISTTGIDLAGLTEDGIRCFVDEWTRQSAPANLIRFITDTTQGNPLFMTELLRHLTETGAMIRLKALGIDANLADIGLPASIREVIGRRLSRLSQACNALLMVASVAGRVFSLPVAEDVTQLPENVLLDTVDEAVAAGILREVAGAPGRFSFTHPLTREVIYARQTAARRVRLHYQLAEAIERHSEPGNLPLAELAWHFGQAAVHGGAQKAVYYACLAGERATAALAMEEATRCYKLALDALEFLPFDAKNRRTRFELHARRGTSFSQAGHWGSAKEDLEAALRLTESHNEEERSELYIKLAEASFWVMDVPGVRHYAGEAQRLADRADRADLWADALAWNGSAQAAEGDVAGAIRSDRIAVARAGGIRSFALARVPLTLYWAGRTAEAVEQSCRAVERARESNDAAFLLYALQHRGLSLAGAGEYGEAIRTFDEACAFGRRCGALPLLARAMCMSVSPLLNLGDLDGARTRALEARELAHRAAFEPPAVSAGIDLLFVSARSYDPGCSETLLCEMHAAVEQARGWHAWKWRLRLAQAEAELALARRRWDEAITAASHVIDQSRLYSRPKYEALGLAIRARASGRLGLRRASDDALASVQTARRLRDPAVLLECLSVLLELDGNDELLDEAQNTIHRMSGSLCQEPLRRRFVASVSSKQGLAVIR